MMNEPICFENENRPRLTLKTESENKAVINRAPARRVQGRKVREVKTKSFGIRLNYFAKP